MTYTSSSSSFLASSTSGIGDGEAAAPEADA
jgi:hypothetical protein